MVFSTRCCTIIGSFELKLFIEVESDELFYKEQILSSVRVITTKLLIAVCNIYPVIIVSYVRLNLSFFSDNIIQALQIMPRCRLWRR